MANGLNLAARITADTSSFASGMTALAGYLDKIADRTERNANVDTQAAGKEVANTGSRIASAAAWLRTMADVTTTIVKGVSALVTWTQTVADSIRGTSRLSDSLGVATEKLYVFKKLVERMGGDSSGVFQGFENLKSKLASIAYGSRDAAESFRLIGLRGSELAGMSLDKAIEKIAATISAIENPAQKAAAAVGIFGDDAKAMLPILDAMGGQMQRLAKDAEMTGNNLNRVDSEKIEAASQAMNRLNDYLGDTFRPLLVQIAPLLTVVAERISDFFMNGFKPADIAAKAMEFLAKGITFVVDLSRKAYAMMVNAANSAARFIQGLIEQLATYFDAIDKKTQSLKNMDVRGVTGGLNRVGGMLNALTTIRAGSPFQAAASGLELTADAIRNNAGAIDGTGNKLRGLAAGFGNVIDKTEAYAKNLKEFESIGPNVDAFFKKVKDDADKAAEQMIKNKTAAGALQQSMKQLARIGDIFKENKSPLELFTEKMTELNKLLAASPKFWDTYARAAARALDELERANGTPELRRAEAVNRYSTQAQSVLNRYDAEQKFQDQRNDPLTRIERILNDSKIIQERTEQTAQQTAVILKNLGVKVEVKIP